MDFKVSEHVFDDLDLHVGVPFDVLGLLTIILRQMSPVDFNSIIASLEKMSEYLRDSLIL